MGLIASFLLAISPWHIHFSRGAWETNIATTFLLLGTWLFLKGLEKPRFLFLSVISYALSMYTYHTPRVVIPLLGFFFLGFYRGQLLKYWKWVLASAFLGLLLITPLLLSFKGPAGSARFSGVSVFSDTGPIWEVNRLRGEHQDPGSLTVKILHNRPVIYALKISQNWLSHFDGNFLFVLGDRIERSNSPGMGEMYLFDLIFVLAGIYFFIKIN